MRCRLVRAAVVAAVVTVVGVPLAQQQAAASTNAATAPGAPDVGYATRLREQLGLSTDLSHLVTLQADPTADKTELGIPLSHAEVADISARPAGQDLADLTAWGTAHPDVWGGIYIDQRAGGIVDVAVTQSSILMTTDFAGMAPRGTRVRTRLVRWTEVQLKATIDAVTADLAALNAAGVQVYAAVLDVAANRVEVRVADATPGLQQLLQARYGTSVYAQASPQPVPASCTRISCPTPWRGGLEISSQGASLRWCTSGYVAKKSTSYYLVTAGHCDPDGTNLNWYNSGSGSGRLIGKVAANAYRNGSAADALIVSIAASARSNYFYVSSTDTARTITSTRTGTGIIGDLVCDSGFKTDLNYCGTIDRIGSVTYDAGAHIFVNQVHSGISHVIGGDSGSPIYYNHILYGELIASDGSLNSWFSPENGVLSELGVAACLSLSC